MSAQTKVIGNDSKLDAILNRHFVHKRSHYIEFGPEKIILPGRYEQFHERIQNFTVRDDDVFILGFMKSGTRWLQELCWLLLNNLDFKTARDTYFWLRAPFLELEVYFEKVLINFNGLSEMDLLESPRCINSHLHWTLLPKAISSGAKQPKIIVILRSPEDTCTSYYHQARVLDGYSGSFDDFCELFLAGRTPFGSYWSNVLALWQQRHRKNIIFVRYNELKTNLSGSIRKIAAFLGKHLSNDDLDKMVDYLTFDNLKDNPSFNHELLIKALNGSVNPFVRKGIIGDHKNLMSADVIEAFNEQKAHYFTGTGLILD